MPRPAMAMPPASTARVPILRAAAGAASEASALVIAMGSICRPASMGDAPLTSCSHCASSSIAAAIANIEPRAAMMPAENTRLRNSCRSSSGFLLRTERAPNQASSARPASSAIHASMAVRLAVLPNILIAQMVSVMPTSASTAAR